MRCKNCGAGLTGQPDGTWWCVYCQKGYEEEDIKNHKLTEYERKKP